jgi:hypothetical protein
MEIYKDKHPVAPLLSSTDHPDKDLPYSKIIIIKKKTKNKKKKKIKGKIKKTER